ncbi:hypothetical protein P692DRAFT_20921341, partial [Suillus brevipes Sb2]
LECAFKATPDQHIKLSWWPSSSTYCTDRHCERVYISSTLPLIITSMRIQLPRLQSTSYLHMTQDTPDTSSNRSESPEAAQYAPHNGLHGFIPGIHYSVPTANAYTGAINMYAPQGPVYATGFAPPVVSQAEVPQAPMLATGFAPPVVFEAQAPGTKRAATVMEGPHAKRAKTSPTAISEDPLFEPMSDEHGQPNGKFKCTKDGMVINSESYRKHIKTK